MDSKISSRPTLDGDSQSSLGSQFKANIAARYGMDRAFTIAAWAATVMAVGILAWLLLTILIDGLGTLNWNFLSSLPSRKAEKAGVVAALFGTLWLMGVVAAVSFPVGVGAGIYLEEFASDNWFTRLVEINIGNLAGVPAIIYGLLGLGVFVRLLEPITGGRSVLSGALTLSLLILPVIIVATREALRAVPGSTRLAGYALGATRWQVIWHHVLPAAMPGILTGVILALSRAIGEAAPLIVVGAAVFISFLPTGLGSKFTALPIQIYNWVSRPQEEFHHLAASGSIVLMTVLLMMNAIAIYLRNRFQKTQ
jgi:phosphate transport system permease protein